MVLGKLADIKNYPATELKYALSAFAKNDPTIKKRDFNTKSNMMGALIARSFNFDTLKTKKELGKRKISTKKIMPANLIGPIKPNQRRKQSAEEKKLKSIQNRQLKSTKNFSPDFIGPLLPLQTRYNKEQRKNNRLIKQTKINDKLNASNYANTMTNDLISNVLQNIPEKKKRGRPPKV